MPIVMTQRLRDVLKFYREVIGIPDPFPGDRLIATANAAGNLAEAVDSAERVTRRRRKQRKST